MLLNVFYKFKIFDDLYDDFYEFGDFILPVLLDYKYKSKVFKSNIYQYYGFKVHLGALSNKVQYFG